MTGRSEYVNPPDVLGYLAVLYQRGLLVSFVGSDMSLPPCTSWPEFLMKLAALLWEL